MPGVIDPASGVLDGADLDVAARICVSPPYYALADLRTGADGVVTASFPVEQELGAQATPIGIAETGRHLAILGLCGVAAVNPAGERRQFSLAARAESTWLAAPTTDGPADRLFGRTRSTLTGRRQGLAETELLDAGGDVLARMRIEYQVLSDGLVRRLFGSGVPAPGRIEGNPYRRPVSFDDVTVTGGEVTAKLNVRAEMCPGHFAGMPMLPVAVAANGMTTLVDHAVAELAGDPEARWVPAGIRLTAERFVPAGSVVDYRLSMIARAGDRVTFRCVVRTADYVASVGEMDIALLTG